MGCGASVQHSYESSELVRINLENTSLRAELAEATSSLREMERQRNEARAQVSSPDRRDVVLTKNIGNGVGTLSVLHTKGISRLKTIEMDHQWLKSVAVTKVATGMEKFDGIAFGDGLFVCAPRNSQQLLIVPIDNPEMLRGVKIQAVSTGNQQFDGVAYGEGLFVCAPRMATKLMTYDVQGDTVRGVDVTQIAQGPARFCGIAYGDGVFACAPRNSDQLLLFKPKTGRLWGIDIRKVCEGECKWHGCAYGEGLFVCAPFHADHLLIYDTGTSQVRAKSVTSIATGLRKFVGIAYGDGIFVCAPYASDNLLVYRPATDTVTGIDVTAIAQGGTKYVGVTYGSGFFACAPQICNQILYYFWKEDYIHGFDISGVASTGAKFAGIAYGKANGDGFCVCAPHASDNLLIAQESRRLRFESEGRGVSVDYLLGDFRKRALQFGSPEELTFHELKNLVFGEDALGYGKLCPRDGRVNCALVDALPRQHRQKATHFLSWVWGYKLSLVLGALDEWLKRSGHKKEDVFLWMCFCCNNQFRIFEEKASAGSDDLEVTFETRLRTIGKVVALLDQWEAPMYNKRIWTQFEQYAATKLDIPVQMILPPQEQASLREEIEKGNFGRVLTALSDIDAENAVASFPADEVKVKQMIRQTVGFNKLNKCVKLSMAQCCSLEFNLVLADRAIGGPTAEEIPGEISEADS